MPCEELTGVLLLTGNPIIEAPKSPTWGNTEFPILGNLSRIEYTFMCECQGQGVPKSLQEFSRPLGGSSKASGSNTSRSGKAHGKGTLLHFKV